ncbi:hypothetical protein HY086_04340 [Candidatus Gottesmanbacteria bacterium]|nr:hypothetical protein [Candidatus Gottesmanbacteria bacterium]
MAIEDGVSPTPQNAGSNEGWDSLGKLIKAAVGGSESAKLALEILENEQKAQIANLELKLQIERIRRASIVYPLPDPGEK